MPPLVRRRSVRLPTLWGWLLVIASATMLAGILARAAHGLLAIDEPIVAGPGARLLVVEGWMDEDDLAQVLLSVPPGRFERVVTSGGPLASWATHPTYAERAADYLNRHGLDGVVAVPSPKTKTERTFVSALAVREWLRREQLQVGSIEVFSAGVHARRTRLAYRIAFGPDMAIGIRATRPTTYDPQRWWTTSEGTKLVFQETLGLLWTTCCFWPPLEEP